MTNSDDSLQLTEQQYNLLVDAKEMDDPRVVDGDDLETIKDVLADALRETTGLPAPEALELPQMAEQLSSDHGDAVAALSQQPETSRPSADDLDESESDADESVDPADALRTYSDPDEIKRKLSLADSFDRNDRLPKHAAELRRECADALGVAVDELDEIDRPSEPTLI